MPESELPDAVPQPPRRRPPAPPPSWPARLGGRVKIALLVVCCLVTQYLPSAWFPFWLAALACLFVCREARTAPARGMIRGGAVFILFWLAVKAASDLFAGAGLADALWGASPFALRLAALTLLGAAFSALSSPMDTGMAAAWYLRPFLGPRAWVPALVVALVAWFLPLALRLPGEAAAAARARGLALPWHRRALLTAGTTLRILRRRADDLALGLASRRLDQDGAWRK